MSASRTTATLTLSDECTLAKQPDCTDMHGRSRQTEDVPLPHSGGLLLQPLCGCACRLRTGGTP